MIFDLPITELSIVGELGYCASRVLLDELVGIVLIVVSIQD
jgi:hypothetical protein